MHYTLHDTLYEYIFADTLEILYLHLGIYVKYTLVFLILVAFLLLLNWLFRKYRYLADSQLIYLQVNGIVDIIYTIDSEIIIAFGIYSINNIYNSIYL